MDFDFDNNGSYDISLEISEIFNQYPSGEVEYERTARADVPGSANDDNGIVYIDRHYWAAKLGNNALINNSSNFSHFPYLLSYYQYPGSYGIECSGLWKDMDPDESAYLGFRFANDNGGLHYGLMRLYVDPGPCDITVYDMAWEDEAGKAIRAGQTVSAVPVPGTLGITLTGMLLLKAIRRRHIG